MEQLKQLYYACFCKDGSVKACGREKCSALITYLTSLDNSISFGDASTGHMDINAIQSFVKQYDIKNISHLIFY